LDFHARHSAGGHALQVFRRFENPAGLDRVVAHGKFPVGVIEEFVEKDALHRIKSGLSHPALGVVQRGAKLVGPAVDQAGI